MEFLKLIALDVGDFYSSIFFEENFPLNGSEELSSLREELETNGYFCMIMQIHSNLQVRE